MKKVRLGELPNLSVHHVQGLNKKVIIKNGEIPHLTNFSEALFLPGQTAPGHAHSDMYEVFLILEGEATFTVNQEDVVVHSGDCLTIELNEFHEVGNRSDQPFKMIYFGVEV